MFLKRFKLYAPPTDAPAEAAVVAAPDQAPVDPADTTSGQSFAEQQRSWTREQRDTWKLTGIEPEVPASAKAPAEKTAETIDEPSATKVGTEVVSEPTDEDQELPHGDSPEAIRSRNQRFARMRREANEYKAKFELLERQLKEKPAEKTAAAPAPETTPKPAAKAKFTFRQPNETETLAEYQAEMLEAHGEFVLDQAEARVFGKMQQRQAEETEKQRSDRLVSEFSERRNAALKQREGESTEDHRTRTLQYANASRWFTGQTEKAKAEFIDDAVLESPVGHLVMQHYHAHQDEFAELLKASNTRALTLIGKVEAKFESEKPPELKPVTRTATPDPGMRVDANVSAKGDPLQEAYDMHTKTGDQKYLKIAMRLENERASAKLAKK